VTVGDWITRQYTRIDLTRLKLQGLISVAGSASMVLTAWVLGGAALVIGGLTTLFLFIGLAGYVLDKLDFHKDQLEEQFKQQSIKIWEKQWEWVTAKIAQKSRMSEAALKEDIARWAQELGCDE